MSTEQSQPLPRTYNEDEVARKIEQERQIVEVDKKLVHITDLLVDSIKDRAAMHIRLERTEVTLYGKDYLDGVVQKVNDLSQMKTHILVTLSALASSGLTLAITYFAKHP